VSQLEWRRIDRPALATLLRGAQVVAASAVGGNTIYRLATDNGEVLALALADGEALVVETAAPLPRRRRRAEQDELSPASR
jgi:hypothetical protein